MSPIGLECSPIGLRKIEKWDKILKCKVRQQSNRRPSESARVQRSDSAVRQSLKIVKLVRIKVSRTLKSPSRTLFSTRKSDKNAKWSDNSVGLFLVRRSPIRSPIGLNSVRSDSDGLRRSQKGVKVASDCCRSPSESDRSPSESESGPTDVRQSPSDRRSLCTLASYFIPELMAPISSFK